jgi:hypothetical protein
MASEILGLFTSPEEYQMRQQQAQQQGQQNAALQFAQLNPFEKASYGIFRGAGQLGQATGSLFGMQDPQLRKITMRQQMITGAGGGPRINMNDPESIRRAALIAQEQGDPEFAISLNDYARKAESEMALIQQRTKEGKAAATPKELQIAGARAELEDTVARLTADQAANPNNPEIARALAIAKNTLAGLPISTKTGEANKDIVIAERRAVAQGLQPNTEAYNKFIDAELLRLTSKEAPGEKANIKEIGVATGSNAPVYLDVNNDKQFIYTRDANGKQVRQDYIGGVDRTTAKVTATATQTGEKSFAEKLGALDAKDVADARTNRDNSIAALNTLNELSRLNDQGLISGSYATGRVGAANLLNTLGLVSPKDQAILASSENYQKKAGDLILATLGGRLGAGFSNEDRKFIQGLVPSLENSPQARRQLIEFMQKKNQLIVDEMTRLEDYARDKNGLKGFKPTIPIISAPKTGAQAYTDAELRAAIAKKKAEAAKSKGQ